MYKFSHLGYFFLFLAIVISAFSIKPVIAGTGKSVTQGGSATINWTVTNAPNCTGTTDYPDGDGIRTSWQNSVNASTGSLTFNSVSAAPGTYTFTCSHRDINGNVDASDSAILTVTGGAAVKGSCSTSGPNGNSPINGCNSGTLGVNNVQANGDSHWYCNGTPNTDANRSPLCWYTPPTINASCSANITLNWNPACSAYYNNTISSGSSVTVNNTASGYTGSQTWSCNNGTWYFLNEACNANSCTNGANNPPACNTCTLPLVWNTSTVSCVSPLAISTPAGSTITLPTTAFSASYTLTNGTGTNSDCYLLNSAMTVVSTSLACTSPFSHNTPLAAGAYGYYVRATKASTGETVTSSMFTVTVNPEPLPDLTAGTVPLTSALAVTSVTLSANITNGGNLSTGASFDNFIQIATEANGEGILTDLEAANMSTLTSNTSAVTSRSHIFSSAGTYYVRACAVER